MATLGGEVVGFVAVHGDELNGIEVTRRVLDDVDLEELNGAVIGVPIVNIQGFYRGIDINNTQNVLLQAIWGAGSPQNGLRLNNASNVSVLGCLFANVSNTGADAANILAAVLAIAVLKSWRARVIARNQTAS